MLTEIRALLPHSVVVQERRDLVGRVESVDGVVSGVGIAVVVGGIARGVEGVFLGPGAPVARCQRRPNFISAPLTPSLMVVRATKP
jgi:hypothetical protein